LAAAEVVAVVEVVKMEQQVILAVLVVVEQEKVQAQVTVD
jgi:hypothetical protein